MFHIPKKNNKSLHNIIIGLISLSLLSVYIYCTINSSSEKSNHIPNIHNNDTGLNHSAYAQFISAISQDQSILVKQQYQLALKNAQLNNDYQKSNDINIIYGYYNLKNYKLTDSFKAFFTVIEQSKEQNDSINLAKGYMGVAGVYYYIENYAQTKEYCNLAFSIFKAKKHKHGLASYYSNMASVYIAEDNLMGAKRLITLSNPLSNELHDTLKLVTNLTILSAVAIKENSYLKSKEYLDQATIIANPSKIKNIQRDILYNYAILYDSLKQYDTANAYYFKTLGLDQNDTLIYNAPIYQGLYQIAEKQKDFKKSLEYYKTYNLLNDRLKGAKSIHKIETLKWSQISNQQKLEKEIHTQNYKIQNYKYSLIIGLIILTTILIYNNYHRIRKSLHLVQKENNNLIESINIQKQQEYIIKYKHQNQLASLNRELTTLNIEAISKAELVNEIKDIVLKKESPSNTEIAQLKKIVYDLKSVDKNIGKFQKVFNAIHPDFFTYIHKNYPKISKTESLICAYIKLNIPNSDIALLLNITHKSLITNRYRIRKKLDLDPNQDLDQTIQSW